MNRRREIKYVVETARARAFLEAARGWMRPDERCPAEGYEVRSLYYDAMDLRHYRDVVEGHDGRLKFRLRRYGSGAQTFLEVKQRLGREVLKVRQSGPRQALEAFLSDPGRHPLAGPVAAYAGELGRAPHRPAAAVCYRRLALVDLLGWGLRVTVDDAVVCGGPELLERGARPSDRRVLPPGLAVLELKLRSAAPSWLLAAVRRLELVPSSYSKYAGAVRRALGGRPLAAEFV